MITELYRRAGVEEYLRDTWVNPRTTIYPLKIRGEDVHGKRKKRMIDLGKSIDKDADSCRPSIIGPLEEILMEMRKIKELVYGLTIVPGEPFTICYSYIAQSDYKKCIKVQKKQGATSYKFERAYSSLA